MKKTRVAILFLLLTLFAACLPAAAELPAQITLPCLGKDRVHKLIEYVEIGYRHHGRYQCTHCGLKVIPYSPYEEHSGGTETPTCTTGKTCALCGAEYGILGHDWSEWRPNDDGTHTRSCKRSNCDAVENESCSGGTGTFTCTKGKTCEKCGAEYGVLGHDWGAWSSAGNGTHIRSCMNYCSEVETESCSGGTGTFTCTKGKTCEKCGAEYGVLGHDWGAWTSNGDGAHTRSCTRCNAEETESCSGGTETPTCTTGKTCEKCGAEYGVLGHKWITPANSSLGNGTHRIICLRCGLNGTASCSGGYATCTSPGVCAACGGSYYGGHDLVQHAAKAPTCTEIGWDAYDTCSRFGCNYTTRKELPALKHDLKQHAAKAPTCTEIGWDAYEACSRSGCNYTTYVELPAQHDLVHHDAQAATCTEKGWDAYDTCSRLGCNYTTYQEKAALKHDLVRHEAKAPTCTGIGWDAYDTCSRSGCNYTTYQEKAALKHDLVHHDAQAATCTGIGWDAYDTCSRLGCNYTTYQEKAALKHDLVRHEAKAPTCTGIGWNAYETCSRCDHTTYQEIPALKHDLVHHEAKAATCTEIGWDAYDTCSRCDYTTYAELPALNHDYQAVTVEPTCETDGYTVFTCSRCKDSYTADPTDRLGHQFGAWSPNGTGSQSADCLRQGCAHTGSTDCRKFTFRTAEGEMLTFCPVCGQAENAAQLEKIEAATAWTISGSLSAADVTARTNGEYLSVAFETAGSLTQPTGLVRLALPAKLLEGKTLVRIAPDGTQTELPFEAKNGKRIFTLDFANSELPVMLFRLVPQTAAL